MILKLRREAYQTFAISLVKDLRIHQGVEDDSGFFCVVPRPVQLSNQLLLSSEVDYPPSDVPVGLCETPLKRPLIHMLPTTKIGRGRSFANTNLKAAMASDGSIP